MTLRDKYPDAYQDDNGTVWVSQHAAKSADWTFSKGDGFMEDILGGSWTDAEENFASCQRANKRKEFWNVHPRLWAILWGIRCWYGALSLFLRTVWRDWHGHRIPWSTAWEMASDLWLR